MISGADDLTACNSFYSNYGWSALRLVTSTGTVGKSHGCIQSPFQKDDQKLGTKMKE